jgi:hypothetical protein
MNSFKNKCKRESTKNKILSGSGHETHYSKKFELMYLFTIFVLFKLCKNDFKHKF